MPVRPSLRGGALSLRAPASATTSDSTTSTIVVSQELFRVGAPPLRPLPVDHDWKNMDIYAIRNYVDPENTRAGASRECLGNVIQEHAKGILRRYGIFNPKFNASEAIDRQGQTLIVGRCLPGQPETSQPTLYVVAPWGPDSAATWPQAVREIKDFCDRQLARIGWTHLELCVELVAFDIVTPKMLHTIVPEPPGLDTVWPDIQDDVQAMLEYHPATTMYDSIFLYKTGLPDDGEEHRPVVLVWLYEDSPEAEWPPVMEQIQTYLDTYQLGLRVRFELEFGHGPVLFD